MKADTARLLTDFLRRAEGTQYVIPVYQRNYTWEKNNQVRKLLIDIDRLLSKECSEHFIGTIVYVDTNSNINQAERAVVDGQQRITTIFLMLYALKIICLENGREEQSEMITDMYLENKYVKKDSSKFRLKPLVNDDQVFEKICKGKITEIKNKKSKVYLNLIYLIEEFKKRLKNNSIEEILESINSLKVVYIQLDNSDNAQQIFESINSTGAALTSADLIRNFLLMGINDIKQTELYNDEWVPFEEGFKDSNAMEDFFRHYLSSRLFHLTKKKEVYDEFKRYYIDAKLNSEIKRENILQEINKYKKAYFNAYFNDTSEEYLLDNRNIKITTQAPLILYMEVLYMDGKIDKKSREDGYKMINSYIIRRMLCSMNSNTISRLFPSLAKNIQKDLDTNHRDFISSLKYHMIEKTAISSMNMPLDNQLKDSLKSANFYGSTLSKFILSKIENMNNKIPLNLSGISIEHILPQTPKQGGYWYKIYNNDYEKMLSNMNNIGNLTFAHIYDNSAMGNKDFDEKKKILADTSHIKMNMEILSKKDWLDTDIKERASKMTQKIISMFPSYRK